MAELVKRSFSLPPDLYLEIVRISEKEDRTVNAQVVRWIEQKVREYQAQEKRAENESGPRVPARLQVVTP